MTYVEVSGLFYTVYFVLVFGLGVEFVRWSFGAIRLFTMELF